MIHRLLPIPRVAVLALILAPACVSEDAEPEALRMLPVSAQTSDGRAVLVGTYDEATQELELVPQFVTGFTDGHEHPLVLTTDTELHPLAPQVVWADALEVGSHVYVVQIDEQELLGSELTIEAPAWTDGLTEAQALSLFADAQRMNPLLDCPPCQQQL